MNESFRLEFRRNGRALAITRFTAVDSRSWPPGLTLDGEMSAWPLGLGLKLTPREQATRKAVRTVRETQHWDSNEFELQVTSNSKSLRFSGVAPDALPPGKYDLVVSLGSVKLVKARHRLQIPEGKSALITLEEVRPTRVLERTTPLSEFHPALNRIVTDERSFLDSAPAAQWMEDPKIRDRRRACLLNVLAKLAVVPTIEDPLANHISYVMFADVDRIYLGAQPSILGRLRRSTKFKRFTKDRTIHSAHEMLRRRIFNSRRGDYVLHSYREADNPSMQVVVAEPPSDFDDETHYADVDIDLGHPGLDVKGFMIHIGEL